MSFTLRNESAMTVLGIYARAENANPEKIGDLWRRFHALGGAGAIESRLNDAVYCVYCEYETDLAGAFTVLIGCQVDMDAGVPDEMKKIEIAGGKFAVFEVVGEVPQSILDAWSEIWQTPLNRRYEADYDRYGADGNVTVHVGVR